MKNIVVAALVVLCVSSATTGWAYNVTFGDSTIHWAGWPGHSSSGWNDDAIDVVGNPDIKGGVAEVSSSGRLQRISFTYSVSPVNDWSMLAPGNLFINIMDSSSDTTWDYAVNTLGALGKSVGSLGVAQGPYDMYSIAIDATKGVNDKKYLLSGKDNSIYYQAANGAKTDWTGYLVRDLHPIGVDFGKTANYSQRYVGAVNFTGFPGTDVDNLSTKPTTSTASATYDFERYFGGLDLLGKDFIIGWEMTCANDVIYETIHNPVPPPTRIPPNNVVPEPSTILLVGAGLAGIGFLRRRS